MGKHSRCVFGICDNDFWYVMITCNTHSCIKSTVLGDTIMHKLPKDGAVRAAWIKAILKDRKL